MNNIAVKFISADNQILTKNILKFELNVQNQDLWVSLEKGSIGSFQQCFFRIVDLNEQEHYFVLKNVFLRYFSDFIEISYNDELVAYSQNQDSKDLDSMIAQYKIQKKQIQKAQAAAELGVSLQEQVKTKQLQEENLKLKLLIDFGLVKQNKGHSIWK